MNLQRFASLLTSVMLGVLTTAASEREGLSKPVEESLRSRQIETVQAFFGLLDEGKLTEAVAMLSPALAPDAQSRDDWKRQFSAIVSVDLVDESEVRADTSDPCAAVKVKLNVRLAPEAARAPIPNYGWDNGFNVRWLELCPEDGGAWRITSIGTGP
jgi:hypothetical protein